MTLVKQAFKLVTPMAVTFSLSLAALALQFWTNADEWVGYNWSEFQWTQSYRIVTCSLLHFSWNHLAWDLGVFAVLAGMCEKRNRRSFLCMIAIASVSIPLVVRFTHAELQTYRGLSGIDSGLFALLALSLVIEHAAKKDWRMFGAFGACLLALVAKVAWEIHAETNIFVSDDSFVPVPLAHMTGVLIGLSLAVAAAISQIPPVFAFVNKKKFDYTRHSA